MRSFKLLTCGRSTISINPLGAIFVATLSGVLENKVTYAKVSGLATREQCLMTLTACGMSAHGKCIRKSPSVDPKDADQRLCGSVKVQIMSLTLNTVNVPSGIYKVSANPPSLTHMKFEWNCKLESL